MILWMVAKSASHHFETLVKTITFFGIYRGIIIPGFLGWCRISSIHSIVDDCDIHFAPTFRSPRKNDSPANTNSTIASYGFRVQCRSSQPPTVHWESVPSLYLEGGDRWGPHEQGHTPLCGLKLVITHCLVLEEPTQKSGGGQQKPGVAPAPASKTMVMFRNPLFLVGSWSSRAGYQQLTNLSEHSSPLSLCTPYRLFDGFAFRKPGLP